MEFETQAVIIKCHEGRKIFVMSGKGGEKASPEDFWYRDGIRFECQMCGKCCRVSGVVWVTSDEIKRIADHLGLAEEEFRERYLKVIWGKVSLIERGSGECIMMSRDSNLCTIYDVRPRQCSSFPFWHDVLRSPLAWERFRSKCLGMGTGRLFTFDEIRERLGKR